MSAVAPHAGLQVLKPALHTGRHHDGHPKSETWSNATRNCKHVVISCGYKVGWCWRRRTCLTQVVCEPYSSEGRGRGSQGESSQGLEVHDGLEGREGRARGCFVCCRCHQYAPPTALIMQAPGGLTRASSYAVGRGRSNRSRGTGNPRPRARTDHQETRLILMNLDQPPASITTTTSSKHTTSRSPCTSSRSNLPANVRRM